MPTKNKQAAKAKKIANISCLVTGFDPFFGQPFNPSQVIAQSMPDELTTPKSKTKISIKHVVLPTTGTKCWQVLEPVLKKMTANKQALVLVMLGMAGKRTTINLERFALNLRDAPIPDNRNRIARNERIIESAPEAFRTKAPVEGTVALLKKKGWPAEISNYAGTFICNEIYFRAQHYFQSLPKKSRLPYVVIFMHLPLPKTYGKTLKKLGTKKTRPFAKNKNHQMKALSKAVQSVIEFSCESLIDQTKVKK